MSIIAATTRKFGIGRIVVDGFALSHQSTVPQRSTISTYNGATKNANRFSRRTRSMASRRCAYSSSSSSLSSSSSAGTTTTGSSDTTATSTSRLFSEEINVLYDSKCNVCKLEMDWLVSRDVRLNGPDNRKLKLTDLEDASFDETDPSNGGIDYDTGMAAIYAIRHDGTVYKGVPVFELAYDQVGLGWVWKLNNVPAINRFFNWGYEIFAKNRTRITRGASLEEILRLNAAKKKAQMDDCETCNNKMSS